MFIFVLVATVGEKTMFLSSLKMISTLSVLLFVGACAATVQKSSFVSTSASSSCSTLPKVYNITAPASDVPKDLSRFSGIWIGYWEDNGKKALCHTLVVEDISANGDARIVYSTEVYPKWGIYESSYGAFEASVNSSSLSATLGNGIKVVYYFNADTGKLTGVYNKSVFGTFVKQ